MTSMPRSSGSSSPTRTGPTRTRSASPAGAPPGRAYALALRMPGDPADAGGAAQDALVRAYRALTSYDRARIAELRLRPWLSTIAPDPCPTAAAPRGAPAA